MFSDTHFHFHHLAADKGLDGAEILTGLCARNTFFALDIGTKADDLPKRLAVAEDSIMRLPEGIRDSARKMLKFSAGIWPWAEEIGERAARFEILKKFAADDSVCAIGECGLDHHWNPSGADGRDQADFDRAALEGERELFEMQIGLARQAGLPLIVHSRDAFDGTLSCLKNCGTGLGIIHCFSYGIGEARVFLDLGYHIAFGGGATYTKKSKMDSMLELLRFVPDDRLLIETDAPYLAPVPFRGQTNTPLLVEHVYKFVAEARGVPAEELSETVDGNIRRLFALRSPSA